MAELMACYDDVKRGVQSTWRYALLEGQDFTIGRRALADLTVPEWNRSEWVVEDPRVSGRHVSINWNGKALQVRRRREPADKPAANPVLYNGIPNDDFTIVPGESFSIGSTLFTLLDQISEKEEESNEPALMTMTITRGELRRKPFFDANTPLAALSELPEMIRNCHDESQLEERVLDAILKGLLLAEFAAFVMLDPRGGREARAAVTRAKQRGVSTEHSPVSHRLVRHALRDMMESVMYVWDKNKVNPTFSATVLPNTDWAICAPLGVNPQGRALYVAGRVPRNIVSEDQLRRDPEFQDSQKFVDLAAEICYSMNELRRIQSRHEQLRRFLPRRMVAVMAQQNLEEQLNPRIADVTALFCDLRGSCQYAAQDSGDMLEAWKRMSAALDIMTSAIDENEGVIGGLQGDAAVGFWGWPNSTPDQIERAVRAALRIRKEFLKSKEVRNSFSFQCGIGIAHGTAVVGRLGVFDQCKLDAYGPVMNLAARLESMTKQFGVQILVDENVAAYMAKNDPVSNRARIRKLAMVRPAGMTAKVEISELMPPLIDADSEESKLPYNQWEIGVKFFIEGNWVNARKRLQTYIGALPKSRAESEKAAHLLLQFMEKQNWTPPEGWDGIIQMEVK